MSDNNLINTFTRGRSRLLQLARRLLDSPEDAEDALQEAFCRLWPRADSLRNQAEAEKLASTVVKNISIDQLRRQPEQLTVDVETLSEDTRFSTEAEQEQREQYEVVSRLIAQRLTPLQQRIKGGFILPVHSPADMKFKHWTSLEGVINIANFRVVPNYSKWWYDIEMGFGVSMMYMKDNTMAYADRDGNLLFSPYPEGTEAKSSMMRSLFLNYDFMAHRNLRKGRSWGLGINLRQFSGYGSDTRTEYIDTDGKSRVLKSEIGRLRPLQWSISAQYNFDQNLYFYLRYSPWGQYHKNGGPNYSSFSLGFGVKL